jgi:thiamine monophosphate synthase
MHKAKYARYLPEKKRRENRSETLDRHDAMHLHKYGDKILPFLREARAALDEGFDYIGFGPLFPTPTKLGRPGIGLADIVAMQSEVGSKIPAFCIGGIKRANLPEVIAAGARRAVIVSDLLTADDVESATKEAREIIVRG